MRELARRLLAASTTGGDLRVPEAVRVIETLRTSLTRFAGADGFTSLLRRALALASADVAWLKSVRVGASGRLEGLEEMAGGKGADAGAAGKELEDGAVAITAHLLGLLVTFVGRTFTLRLVREAWPDVSLDE